MGVAPARRILGGAFRHLSYSHRDIGWRNALFAGQGHSSRPIYLVLFMALRGFSSILDLLCSHLSQGGTSHQEPVVDGNRRLDSPATYMSCLISIARNRSRAT